MHCVTAKVSVTQIHYLETHPQEATGPHGHKCEELLNLELNKHWGFGPQASLFQNCFE